MTRILPFGRRGATGDAGPGEAAQVLSALRHHRLHRRSARDGIPAYLVIGPPGMGKSAFIERSGLHLDRPLELASSNWWIGEDVFLIEVAHEPDPDGGHPVLPLLRALRPMVPVSGIILVVSPADLTLADATERAEMSGAITRFLRAFEARFRYAPPLYVVVSKLDLTPGFAEFFDRLEPAEREQPWGFSLPVGLGRPGGDRAVPRGPDDPKAGPAAGAPGSGPAGAETGAVAAAYQEGFRRLLGAIRTRVTHWTAPETDPVQCARIVGFGAQVAALESILKPVIEPLMPADDRRWAGAWLRGVYLTSMQQDALAIDVLLPELAKRFGLPRSGTLPPDLGRDDEVLGYFVVGTFRRVILPEAGLAQQGHRGARRAAIRGWALTAATLAACIAVGVACVLSYRDGVARIVAVNEAVVPIDQQLATADPEGVPAVLKGLDALSALRGPGGDAHDRPIVSLDRYAQALIARGGAVLYDRALGNGLGPHLAYRLERDLVGVSAPSASLRRALDAAVAGRTDGLAAYNRWLQGEAESLPQEAQAPLVRHGTEAFRIGAAPGAGPAYTDFARAVLESRGGAR